MGCRRHTRHEILPRTTSQDPVSSTESEGLDELHGCGPLRLEEKVGEISNDFQPCPVCGLNKGLGPIRADPAK